MKRLLILLCVAGLLAAIPLSHVAMAKKPTSKVAICHMTDSALDYWGGTATIGHVINVSENAVDAHLAHGDVLAVDSIEITDEMIGYLEGLGLDTEGADCGAYFPAQAPPPN